MRLLLCSLLCAVARASSNVTFVPDASVSSYLRMETNCNVDRLYKPSSRADVQTIVQEASQQMPKVPLVKAMGRGMSPTFSWYSNV
ncbi:MAG: hypothetical protein MHM6MM_008451 [Cercozoa sp. M6MM]